MRMNSIGKYVSTNRSPIGGNISEVLVGVALLKEVLMRVDYEVSKDSCVSSMSARVSVSVCLCVSHSLFSLLFLF